MDENTDAQKDPAIDFVEKLLAEREIDADPETLAQLKADLVDRVEDHVNAAILENIPADKMEEFEQVIEKSDEEAIRDFCRQNIANLDEVVGEALLKFRATYLNV